MLLVAECKETLVAGKGRRLGALMLCQGCASRTALRPPTATHQLLQALQEAVVDAPNGEIEGPDVLPDPAAFPNLRRLDAD